MLDLTAMASDTAVFSLSNNRFQHNRSLTGRRDSSLQSIAAVKIANDKSPGAAEAGTTSLKTLPAAPVFDDNDNATAGTYSINAKLPVHHFFIGRCTSSLNSACKVRLLFLLSSHAFDLCITSKANQCNS